MGVIALRSSVPPADADAAERSTLDRLRMHAIRVWAVVGWAGLACLFAVDLAVEHGNEWALLIVGCSVNALPTVMAIRRRYDVVARMVIAAPATIIPAMMVFLLERHAWQMDAHMFFFIAMSGLVFLGDWRPIVLMTVLTAAHHIVLEWVAPAYVFTGSGNFDRVAFHIVTIGIQCMLLIMLTMWLERLFTAQDGAISNAKRLVETAEAEGRSARGAMEQARITDAAAVAERHHHEAAARRTSVERRAEFVTLAHEFERSVTRVVKAIAIATEGLEQSVARLDVTTADANLAAGEVATGAADAATEIVQVATSIRALSGAVQRIAIASDDQTTLTATANAQSRHSVDRVAALEVHANLIGGLAENIREIAGKTNLLALNATIEAARAGDAGRGFTIVAGEVKSLSADTARASEKISALLTAIRAGVAETGTSLRGVNGAIGDVATAADGIAAAAQEQRATVEVVDAAAERAMRSASDITQRIGEVAAAASLAATLSAELKGSASDLATSARSLRGASDLFLAFLHHDTANAA